MAGILYVDDTNLWAGMEEEEDLDKAVYDAQESVAFWSRSLIATGSALNPGKCKWSIHDLIPKEDLGVQAVQATTVNNQGRRGVPRHGPG